jgi:rubredoxin-NAD+ reductase
VAYRDLVLACGAEPIRLPVEGDADGLILPVNDLEDYARFCQAAAGKQRVLILGAGLIGCEFANDLSLGGYQVELVAPCEQVMPGLLPVAAAAAVQAGLQGLGVRFHLGPVLSRLQHQGEDLLATLSDGSQLHCDLVLSAVGLRPRTELARQAGLQCARGIQVDRQLRSSAAHVYALGDCAEVDGLNLQYVMPLMTCARALAQTLAGKPTAVAYGPMPVTVKTPVCPLVVSPPPPGSQGSWSVAGSGADIRALCRADDGRLLGYALTGAAVQDKLALNRELPPLLP